jgi:hypothetical protein
VYRTRTDHDYEPIIITIEHSTYVVAATKHGGSGLFTDWQFIDQGFRGAKFDLLTDTQVVCGHRLLSSL